MTRAPREVAVGVIRRPFGLSGEVFVHPDPDLADQFPPGRRYRLAPPHAPDATAASGPADPASPPVPRELTVAESFVHRGLQVVRFEEVGDRDRAAALRDAVLWRDVDAEDTDEDSWWTADLLGRPVSDPDGRPLGTVQGVSDGTAHDYLVVRGDREREVLVPLVADLVTITAEQITVRPPPGLFDPDAATDA